MKHKRKLKRYEEGGVQSFVQGISPILGMIPGIGGTLQTGAGLIGGLLGRLEDQEVDHKKALVDNPYMANGGLMMGDYVFSKKLGTAPALEKALKNLGAYDAVVKYKGRNHKDGGILVNEKYQTIAGGTTNRQKMTFGGTPIAELEGGEIRVEPNELDGLDEITRNTALLQIQNAMRTNEALRSKMKNGGRIKYQVGGSISPYGKGIDPKNMMFGDESLLGEGELTETELAEEEAMKYFVPFNNDASGAVSNRFTTLPLISNPLNNSNVVANNIPTGSITTQGPPRSTPSIQVGLPQPTQVRGNLTVNPVSIGPSNSTAKKNTSSSLKKPSGKSSNSGELTPLMLGKGLEILTQLPSILRGVEQEKLQLNPNAQAVESQMRQRRINLDPMRNAIMSQRSASVGAAQNNSRSASLRNALTNAAYSRAGQSLANVSMQEQQMRNQYRADLAGTLNNLGMQEAAERIRKQTADSQNQAAFDNSLRELGRTAGNIGTFAQNYNTNNTMNQEMLQLMNMMYSRFGNTDDIKEYRKKVLSGEGNIEYKAMYGGYFPKRKRR